jgi:hypothetical protein
MDYCGLWSLGQLKRVPSEALDQLAKAGCSVVLDRHREVHLAHMAWWFVRQNLVVHAESAPCGLGEHWVVVMPQAPKGEWAWVAATVDVVARLTVTSAEHQA